MTRARLIVHGGAWDWDDSLDAPKRESILIALRTGWEILLQGGHALDAVERAVNWLEDDPLFDAGTGSHINAEGIVEMDALIIDADRRAFGAVGAVQRVQNPISLARKVLDETQYNFYVGPGADALAERLGMPIIPNISLITERERADFFARNTSGPSDTVGAIAMDVNGRIAAATSTGGTPLKPMGRIGDSPIFGAGGYGDLHGAAGATGKGEHAMRVLLSRQVVDEMRNGKSAQSAADAAIEHLEELISDSMVGIIAIDRQGNLGAAHSTRKLACGWIDENGVAQASMQGGLVATVSR